LWHIRILLAVGKTSIIEVPPSRILTKGFHASVTLSCCSLYQQANLPTKRNIYQQFPPGSAIYWRFEFTFFEI